jgi:hypothetical protein
MKAITLIQPWASLIADGRKKVETRSWGTKYRGPLAIHAGKSSDKEAMRDFGYRHPIVSGAIICLAELYDCRQMTGDLIRQYADSEELRYGNWEVGRWAWFLRNVHVLDPPEKIRGALGLWEWALPNGEIDGR